jgi:hypothetical protein
VYRSYLPRSWDYRDSRVETNATSGFLSPAQIRNHAAARVRCSLTAGLDIALMKSGRMIAQGTLLKATGARVIDDDRGIKPSPAAHAIPCGISVAGRGPLHLIPHHRKMQEFIAEPYRYTNIVPKALNDADHKAEAFGRRDGTGLVRSFERFCQSVLSMGKDSRGILNKFHLRSAFGQLMKDYQTSFSLAFEKLPRIPSGRVTFIPGVGNQIDPDIEYTDQEFDVDNIRTALRGQLTALKELEGSEFSNRLVEQVESDFHSAVKESGE